LGNRERYPAGLPPLGLSGLIVAVIWVRHHSVLESAVLAGLLGSIVATALACTRVFWSKRTARLPSYIMALVSASPWDAGKPEGSRVDHPFR